jgi:hypothetical protein
MRYFTRGSVASRTASRLYSSENFLLLATTNLRPRYWSFWMCPRNPGRTHVTTIAIEPRTGANMPNPKRSCQNTTYRWCGKRSLKFLSPKRADQSALGVSPATATSILGSLREVSTPCDWVAVGGTQVELVSSAGQNRSRLAPNEDRATGEPLPNSDLCTNAMGCCRLREDQWRSAIYSLSQI